MGRQERHSARFWAVHTSLPRDPACARVARRFVGEHVPTEVGPDELGRALLIVSELVTNAYRHGEGAIELRLSAFPDRIRIEVIDQGSGATPEISQQTAGPHGGWGLGIVDELAHDWGRFEGTTHVWADLPRDSRPARPCSPPGGATTGQN